MTYELAKKLKDAGFPQGESMDNILAKGTALAYLRDSKPSDELLEKYKQALNSLKELYEDDEEYVYVPTLSELIEACGTHVKLDWFPATKSAFANCCDSKNHEQHGSTPEEAVANLWLALNKNGTPTL